MSRVSTADVVIIGGGVIGAACARVAAERGLHVAVFEPGPDPGAASPASAGMLAAQIEPTDQLLLSLGVRSRDRYEALAAALKDTTGIDIGFWRGGIASVALAAAEVDQLREHVALQRQAGLRCDWLEPGDVHERWPSAAPECVGALFAPEDGAVDPQALTRALLSDARRLGAALVTTPVEELRIADGRVTGVRAAGSTVAAERVVLAAGAWSPRLKGLHRELPIEPVRGQMASTAWPVDAVPAILYHIRHGYVLARGGDAILGSTMEHAGFDAKVTNEGLAQIFRSAVRLLPALAALPVARTWAGLRPVTPDGRPIVGPDPDAAGLYYATGHGRNGVLLAALTAEIIGDLLTTGTTDVDIEALSPTRAFTPLTEQDILKPDV